MNAKWITETAILMLTKLNSTRFFLESLLILIYRARLRCYVSTRNKPIQVIIIKLPEYKKYEHNTAESKTEINLYFYLQAKHFTVARSSKICFQRFPDKTYYRATGVKTLM